MGDIIGQSRRAWVEERSMMGRASSRGKPRRHGMRRKVHRRGKGTEWKGDAQQGERKPGSLGTE